MDFNIVGASLINYSISLAIWLVVLFVNRSQINKYSTKGTSYLWLWVFMTLFSTFGFIGLDFSGYKSLYDSMALYHERVHVEYFYFWLTNILPNSYYIWRFTIWGLAAAAFVIALKRQKCEEHFSSFIVVVILLFTTFYYLRNSLGLAVLVLGITYYATPLRNKSKSYLIALALIVLSSFLHKSMIACVLLLIFAFLSFNKKTIVLSLIAFPFLYVAISQFSGNFLALSFIGSDTLTYGNIYLENETHLAPTLFGWIDLLMKKLPAVILLLYAVRNVYFKERDEKNIFINYAYILFYVSFLYLGNTVSTSISDRFWVAAMFPFTMFLCKYLYNKRQEKIVKYSLILLIFSNIYSFVSSIYNL